MMLKRLSLTLLLGAATTVAVPVVAWASGHCPICAMRECRQQEQYLQARQFYRHANTLVNGIEARNRGKHFQAWQPVDQVMHRHRTRLLQELVNEHPRLADDQEANMVIKYHVVPAERYYKPPLAE